MRIMAAADSREVENGCGESGWWSGVKV